MKNLEILKQHNEKANSKLPQSFEIRQGRKGRMFTLWFTSPNNDDSFVKNLGKNLEEAAQAAVDYVTGYFSGAHLPTIEIATSKEETDANALPYYVFSFGKYKGQKIEEVMKQDIKYLVWFLMQCKEKEEELNEFYQNNRYAKFDQLRSAGLWPLNKREEYVLNELQPAIWEAYNEWKAAQEPEKPESKHVGTVKERVELNLKIERISYFDSQYGYNTVTTWVFTMVDENGNCFLYKGSKHLNRREGDSIKLKATIKEHSEYKGRKQTVIQRPKVENSGFTASKREHIKQRLIVSFLIQFNGMNKEEALKKAESLKADQKRMEELAEELQLDHKESFNPSLEECDELVLEALVLAYNKHVTERLPETNKA